MVVQFTAADAGVVRIDNLVLDGSGSVTVSVSGDGLTGSAVARVLPGWFSVLPPLLAIVMAILFRQVVVALLVGVLTGAVFVHNMQLDLAIRAFMDTYIVQAITGEGHESIIVFSLLLGGMVGVISRAGGTFGIVNFLTRFAKTPRSGQVATAGLGTLIFFDDYANCLIVGNTMRPLTDRLRISREKLAYIVDSTAAPVASFVPLSTWVGYQVGLIADSFGSIEALDASDAYPMVLQAMPYMFYPIFALLLVYAVAILRRDILGMHQAEQRARATGKVLRDGAQPLSAGDEDASIGPKEGAPHRAINALLPILAVIGVTIWGLYRTGVDGGADLSGGSLADVRAIIKESDSFKALLWASFSGLALAVILAWVQRILTLEQSVQASVNGMKSMLLAMIILVLSWSLGAVTDELHARDYLVGLLGETVSPHWLPLLVFLLAAGTAFATGTAWGTMGILMPLIVPLVYFIGSDPIWALEAARVKIILLGSIASVLGGAVFGDHCSPISDTTILSSMATSCDHIDHVRTQIPYAILAVLIALLAGYVPVALGFSCWIGLPLGVVALPVLVLLLGRRNQAQQAVSR